MSGLPVKGHVSGSSTIGGNTRKNRLLCYWQWEEKHEAMVEERNNKQGLTCAVLS